MDEKRKVMLMNMTDEEIWRSQFDQRDFEASQILLDLQRQPVLLPPPEPKERTPFLVVWGRKKRLVSRTRRVSGGLNSTTLATLFPSKATPLTNGQPSSKTEDSCKNKRRRLLSEGESAVEKPLTNSQPKMKRRKLLSELAVVQKSSAEINNGFHHAQTQVQRQSTSLIGGPMYMGFVRVQPKQLTALYEQAKAREARKIRMMKIQQRQYAKKMLISTANLSF